MVAAFCLVTLEARGGTPAEAAFEAGKKLMSAKRYADACEKFAESDRLSASGGAVANLADCFRLKTGVASAIWPRARLMRRGSTRATDGE